MPLACALLTPPGRGAIATIGVRGPDALAIVARCLEPRANTPLTRRNPGDIVAGLFMAGDGSSEELVVGIRSTEHVEIHCHGGLAASAAILETLARLGCRVQSPSEWLGIEQHDPNRTAALLALGQCTTAKTSGYLLDQYHGALSKALSQIASSRSAGDQERADALSHSLLRWAHFGLHLTHPWRIVLAGEPNSGKSSLMNAIVGYQRAIVFDQPGTTRDVLLAQTAIDGWPVELRDMAGLRTTSAQIEATGIERAWQEIASADLVLYVSDSAAAWNAELYASILQAARGAVLIVHNKSDLAAVPAARPPGQSVSATRGDGVDALCQTAMHRLIPEIPPRGSAIPFTIDQIESLKSLLTHDRSERP